MVDLEHREFSAGDSGAALSYPLQCSALRKGGFVCIKGRPCKIVEMSTSKTGKHGHAKVHIVGTDVFTSKKLEDVSPSTHNVDVPIVARNDFQLLNIEGDYLSLMSAEGDIKEDVKIPSGDLGKAIRADFEQGKDLMVTVLKSMGEEQVTAHKDAPNCKFDYFADSNKEKERKSNHSTTRTSVIINPLQSGQHLF